MSRIRSVHPGLHTSERFVSVSFAARLMWIGIWNESDDHGVFEWSPLMLKMRILPADSVDATQLLEELAGAQLIMRFEENGRAYGVVRAFLRWQRPKKPSYFHPCPEPALAFATSGSEPVPHQFGTAGEKSPQRKEEGGRKDTEANASGADAPTGKGELPLGDEPPAPAEPVKPIDLKAAVFASGVPFLVKSGLTDRNARSMLGRWRSTYTDGAVMDALSAAQAESPSDAVAWMNRTLETRYGNRSVRGERRSGWLNA
ncbi:hypothetical protein ACFB49_42710 [Sphingomonas sp. DBB INV C78]|uniref:hypothetical protein n=1 Tax=Sphingomonas sp. DBB INV C78 TaxID=3349434 RepID=UPI0036D237E1